MAGKDSFYEGTSRLKKKQEDDECVGVGDVGQLVKWLNTLSESEVGSLVNGLEYRIARCVFTRLTVSIFH